MFRILPRSMATRNDREALLAEHLLDRAIALHRWADNHPGNFMDCNRESCFRVRVVLEGGIAKPLSAAA